MRVLYVEDDDNLAFAVEQMLQQEGHECDRARSGVGAVKLGQEQEYDVILLDVMLPDIDGYEVLRQLQDVGVETPVLIQSGLVERDRAMDGLGFGVDDYLIKPFNRDELIRRVEQAATRRSSPPSAADIKAEPVTDADELRALPPPEPPPEPAPSAAIAEIPAPPTVDEPPAVPAEPDPTVARSESPLDMAHPAEAPAAPDIPDDPTPPVPSTPYEPPEPEGPRALAEAPEPIFASEPAGTPEPEPPPLPGECPALSARIVAASSQSIIDCTIVTVASGGAVLDVYNETVECPDEFLLAVTGDKSYRCESCWRHGGKLGVKFV